MCKCIEQFINRKDATSIQLILDNARLREATGVKSLAEEIAPPSQWRMDYKPRKARSPLWHGIDQNPRNDGVIPWAAGKRDLLLVVLCFLTDGFFERRPHELERYDSGLR